MFELSRDSSLAEQQVRAFAFALVAFGYIDGELDQSERDFIVGELAGLARQRAQLAPPSAKQDGAAHWAAHHHALFEQYDTLVRGYFTESVSDGESHEAFVVNRLKLGCLELLGRLETRLQRAIVEAVEHLMHADGRVHPNEAAFLTEVSALLRTEVELGDDDLEDDSAEEADASEIRILPPSPAHPNGALDHPVLQALEQPFSSDPQRFAEQRDAEIARVTRVEELFRSLRSRGAGALARAATTEQLPPGPRVLDGRVYVQRPLPSQRHELLVLGDLHGCYSCLKAAVMQGRFFEKVEAFRNDPDHAPEPRLVLLGDYIDRGIFSLNGVLRAVMQLFVAAPGHVHVLRGNHEYYVEHKGQIYGGVRPSEAIDSLRPHLPIDVFRRYAQLFDALPNMLLFDRTLFVHGGIPRDRLVKERWKDLSSLNDPDLRFQMMWSDPSLADVIPAALQEQTARFPFGRLQLQSFLGRIGCHTLIRGHEKVNAGVERVYDGEEATLVTVFSAGGRRNADLPPRSSYRAVTPKALLVQHEGGQTTLSPFELDWAAYNDPERNGFFRDPMEIEHRSG
jgi:hypothetical protein